MVFPKIESVRWAGSSFVLSSFQTHCYLSEMCSRLGQQPCDCHVYVNAWIDSFARLIVMKYRKTVKCKRKQMSFAQDLQNRMKPSKQIDYVVGDMIVVSIIVSITVYCWNNDYQWNCQTRDWLMMHKKCSVIRRLRWNELIPMLASIFGLSQLCKVILNIFTIELCMYGSITIIFCKFEFNPFHLHRWTTVFAPILQLI